jgi:hypothetical protein
VNRTLPRPGLADIGHPKVDPHRIDQWTGKLFVMPLSQRSVALIGQAAAEWGHAQLTAEVLKAGLGEGDPGQSDRSGRSIPRDKRAISAVEYARRNARWDDLLLLAAAVLNAFASSDELPAWTDQLVSSLRRDGFDAIASNLEPSPDSWFRSGPLRQWSIAPLGGSDLPIVDMTTALARELEEHGFPIASNHYRQAFDAFKSRQWEASNGQLRSTFENVLVEATRRAFGWTGKSGGQALEMLLQKGALDKNEHDYLRGLWGMSHSNGSHPGMSNETEAELRLAAITSAVRFILNGVAET